MAYLSKLSAPNLSEKKFFELADRFFSQFYFDEDKQFKFSFKNAPFDVAENEDKYEILQTHTDNKGEFGFAIVWATKDEQIEKAVICDVKDKDIFTSVYLRDKSDQVAIQMMAKFLMSISWETELYYYDPNKREETGLVNRFTNADRDIAKRLKSGVIPSVMINLSEYGVPALHEADLLAVCYFGFLHVYCPANAIVAYNLGLGNYEDESVVDFYNNHKVESTSCENYPGVCRAFRELCDNASKDESVLGKANSLLEQISTYKKDAQIKELEELNSIYAKDNESLTSRLKTLENEVENLKAQAVRPAFQSYSKADPGLGLKTNEKDLYAGEVKDVILKLINKELRSMSGDKNMMLSRKYAVLKDISDNNELTGEDERLRQFIKETVGAKDFHVNAQFRGKLKAEGFNIDETKAHPRIWLGDDERFSATLSSTPGDSRAAMNTASDFCNILFAY